MESLENSLKRGLFGLRPLALPVLRNVLPPNLISTDQSNAIGSVRAQQNAADGIRLVCRNQVRWQHISEHRERQRAQAEQTALQRVLERLHALGAALLRLESVRDA